MKNICYGKQFIDQKDIKAVVDVLKSDWLTQGSKVVDFEKALCRYTGAKYAVAVSSGTAALHLSCLAAGIKGGDEVITSAITFAASANCALYCGAKPVFADVLANTINIDSNDIEAKITQKTKVIIPVHFAGLPCDLESIYKTSKKNKIIIIEDASHALGASYKKSTIGDCKYSDMTVFSFHPVKPITAGEGGAILTNKRYLYEKLILLRNHGITKDKISRRPGPWYYEMQELGFNYRITDIQCALGISQLKKLQMFRKRREQIAARYDKAFKFLDWLTSLERPKDRKSAFHVYPIKIDFNKTKKTRKQVMDYLTRQGICSQVHYIPVYQHPYYQKNIPSKVCKVAEEYYQEALTLPLYFGLSDKQVDYVVSKVVELG